MKARMGRISMRFSAEGTPRLSSMGLKQVEPWRRIGHLKRACDGAHHLLGGRNVQIGRLTCFGMRPSEVGAGEVQAVPGVQGGSAVNAIPNDRMAQGRGVPSNLMCASALERPFHQACLPVHAPPPMTKATKVRATHLALKLQRNEATARVESSRNPSVVGFGDVMPVGLEVLAGLV